ncbi:MAG: hypothetical protein GKR89_23615 [Candidatus Latescibacteria bacterium]|nr:hypothetical protein [Candidatus Latescibacterota bacterium]
MSLLSSLPSRPNLRQLKNQAKRLLKAHHAADAQAAQRLRKWLPELANRSDAEIFQVKLALKDAQRAITREYGFNEWGDLKRHIETSLVGTPIHEEERQRIKWHWACVEAWIPHTQAEMNPLERQFVEAAMGEFGGSFKRLPGTAPPPVRTHTAPSNPPDIQPLAALLKQDPTLIETAGSAALAATFRSEGTDPIARFLVEQGACLECPEGTFRGVPKVHTPLLNAAGEIAGGQLPIDKMRIVLEAGLADAWEASIEAYPGHNYTHQTPLHRAAEYGHAQLAELLLRHGADRNMDTVRLNQRDTALQLAAGGRGGLPGWKARRHEVAQVLLAQGAYYDLFTACALDDTERLGELLAEDPMAPHTRHPDQTTPLHWAAKTGALAGAEILLHHGADVNALSSNGETPLHLACAVVPSIWLLAENGANLNVQDDKGRAPLHLATYGGHIESAEVLIVLGADTRKKNRKGKTPLEIARMGCRHLKPKPA